MVIHIVPACFIDFALHFSSFHWSGQTFPLQWLDLLTGVVRSNHSCGKV